MLPIRLTHDHCPKPRMILVNHEMDLPSKLNCVKMECHQNAYQKADVFWHIRKNPGIVHADDLLGVLFHTTFRCLIQRVLRHHQQYGYESASPFQYLHVPPSSRPRPPAMQAERNDRCHCMLNGSIHMISRKKHLGFCWAIYLGMIHLWGGWYLCVWCFGLVWLNYLGMIWLNDFWIYLPPLKAWFSSGFSIPKKSKNVMWSWWWQGGILYRWGGVCLVGRSKVSDAMRFFFVGWDGNPEIGPMGKFRPSKPTASTPLGVDWWLEDYPTFHLSRCTLPETNSK